MSVQGATGNETLWSWQVTINECDQIRINYINNNCIYAFVLCNIQGGYEYPNDQINKLLNYIIYNGHGGYEFILKNWMQ